MSIKHLAALLLLLSLPAAQAANGPDLSVTKTCAPNGAHSVMCTVTVTNVGNAASASPMTVFDTATATPGATATYGGGPLHQACTPGLGPIVPVQCVPGVSLQPGESARVRFGYDLPEGGALTNCVTVTQARVPGALPDPVPANNVDICTSYGDMSPVPIRVVKRIVNETSHRIAGPFRVAVTCTPAIAATTLLLSAPGFQQTIPVSPLAVCRFIEARPPAPPGCRWKVSYPNGQTARGGGTVVIRNELSCSDPLATCPAGNTLTRFPGAAVAYCCTGKPGSEGFCCRRSDLVVTDPRGR